MLVDNGTAVTGTYALMLVKVPAAETRRFAILFEVGQLYVIGSFHLTSENIRQWRIVSLLLAAAMIRQGDWPQTEEVENEPD